METKLKYGQFAVIEGKGGSVKPENIISPSYGEVREILQQTDEEVAQIELVLIFELNKSGGFRINVGGVWSRTQIVGAIELLKHHMMNHGR